MASPDISTASGAPCALVSVIATDELGYRPARFSDSSRETNALLTLTRELSNNPQSFFTKLVETALELSGADSTGISLLDETETAFVWPAVAGKLKSYLGEGTPRDFGPCGTVLDRKAPVLFLHPERHFTYLEPIKPPLEEVLLIPFFVHGKPVGTIWAVLHTTNRKFDAEDKRLLEVLSSFASSAYGLLAESGRLSPMRKKKPVISYAVA